MQYSEKYRLTRSQRVSHWGYELLSLREALLPGSGSFFHAIRPIMGQSSYGQKIHPRLNFDERLQRIRVGNSKFDGEFSLPDRFYSSRIKHLVDSGAIEAAGNLTACDIAEYASQA